jgi:uroporphyrinogen-III synthase
MSESTIQDIEVGQPVGPLRGKRILVTRTRLQASALSSNLRALGATPVEFPTIRIVPPPDWGQLDQALTRLYSQPSGYDWLIFTSVNGVQSVCERMLQPGYETHTLQNVRIAAIGPATASALERYGLHAEIVPGEYVAEGVAAALLEDARVRGETLRGRRVLLARAAEARRVLVDELEHAGALVDEVAAYYTVAATADDEQGRSVLHLLQTHQLSIITFTSSSTVRNFVAWLRSVSDDALTLVTGPRRPILACIGPITAQTARELGLSVAIEAREFTIDGLVQAILHYEELA